jgi:hypothetical protein
MNSVKSFFKNMVIFSHTNPFDTTYKTVTMCTDVTIESRCLLYHNY